MNKCPHCGKYILPPVTFKVLVACRGLRFMEIHRQTGIAQSSLAKFLNDLKSDKLVRKDENKEYWLTDAGLNIMVGKE